MAYNKYYYHHPHIIIIIIIIIVIIIMLCKTQAYLAYAKKTNCVMECYKSKLKKKSMIQKDKSEAHKIQLRNKK